MSKIQSIQKRIETATASISQMEAAIKSNNRKDFIKGLDLVENDNSFIWEGVPEETAQQFDKVFENGFKIF